MRKKGINMSGEKAEQQALYCQVKNIGTSVDENLLYIKSKLGDGIGLSQGKFNAFEGKIKMGVAYIDSLCDKQLINNQVIAPLLKGTFNNSMMDDNIGILVKTLYISTFETKTIEKREDVITELLNGNTAVFFENCSGALIVSSRKAEKRAIEKSENEMTVFAAREAFVEDLDTNISMVLRRLPLPDIQLEAFTLGQLSQTNTKFLWIKGLAKEEIVDEVRRRLENVDIDMIDGASNLAELIQNKPTSIFPTYRLTERPDVVARALSSGYCAIICNNSPFALVVPMSFWDSFKTMDDYSQLPLASTLLRIIRIMAFIISFTISPMYLSFVTYNHTIVPPSLALNISKGRDGVPFPSIIELIAMTIIIDIIREAGVRMPGMVGYFIGTLGAVIIGQAAVEAGYVSVSLIIVVAFSAIATFAISSTTLVNTSRIINYLLILISGFLGIFGFFYGSFIILWKMSILESFGVPYLYPIIPVEFKGWRDFFIRAPFKMLKTRLTLFSNMSSSNTQNRKKQ